MGPPPALRPPLPGSVSCDVAIVGAGFTGLWTAYYLSSLDPSLRVVVLESAYAGFGASGRNGGWCSALLPSSLPSLAQRHGRAAAISFQRSMNETVDEVGRVCLAEGISCDFHKGGTVSVARSPAQLSRAASTVSSYASFGFDEVALLSSAAASARLGATSVLGGVFTPHCAAIQPASLVRGLASVVAARGVALYEGTPVTSLRPGAAVTPFGTVRAPVVVRATEGYTAELPGHRRAVAPIYSLMVATAPLPASAWEEIGLADRETFTDFRHLIIYGQRTADGRLAFGGRGAPYHFGSSISPSFDQSPGVFAALRQTLGSLFPVLGPLPEISHAWGGPLGVTRDWTASVGLDRATGLAWAGGYVGDGVGTSNLAGRTLADLILEMPSELVSLPWVGHRSRPWEPEPLRWLGINAALRATASADATEARTGRASRRADLIHRLVGG
ncbi:Glycine/D-amino acid oxidase [Asanoa hainanensis]|uniref:Glycine/D-amino acid oxidase n=2 Tax=Asanoa hainanensis TaxID=560556 RepID=A0A239ICT6_9ACTN|nr:FAD-dependent oxidoreductase [Asanoa hainanensis]SNS91365.1 Glycine/D-amino acid oxidase [Asanoa hainanensis]